jgi:hypothetical protein
VSSSGVNAIPNAVFHFICLIRLDVNLLDTKYHLFAKFF